MMVELYFPLLLVTITIIIILLPIPALEANVFRFTNFTLLIYDAVNSTSVCAEIIQIICVSAVGTYT